MRTSSSQPKCDGFRFKFAEKPIRERFSMVKLARQEFRENSAAGTESEKEGTVLQEEIESTHTK